MTTPLRTPLHSEEAERGVLGSILLDAAKVFDFCKEKGLRPSSFHVRAHQTLFELMEAMASDNRPIDVLSVSERLQTLGRLDEVGGVAALDRLLESTPTPAHAEYYIDIVRQKHILRGIVERAREAENRCYTSEDDAESVLGKVEESFFEIAANRFSSLVSWPDAINDTIKTIDHILKSKKGITGIPTGLDELDTKLMGLHPSDMIVLAARPSMGKTSLAMNIAENVALGKTDHEKRPVGIFSLEMSRESLVMRMLCSHARVKSHRIASGYVSPAEFQQLVGAASVLQKAPIVLDDSGGLDIETLRSRARRLKKNHDIRLFIIDYLQLLHDDRIRSDGRQAEVSNISSSLKAMAKELKVPVVVLSQLNRAPEIRDKTGKPRLADLRESGAIEQDADVVLLLRRPFKYDGATDDDGDDPTLAVVDVAKQRNGPTGEIKLTFLEDITRFENRTGAATVEEGAGPEEDAS